MAWWFGWGGWGWGRRRGWRGGWGWGGFGWGRGWGGGWGRGWGGPGWGALIGWPLISSAMARGYYYIGPCRSGLGPFAFYMTPDGRIVHAWQVYGLSIPYPPFGAPWSAPSASPYQPGATSSSEKDALLRERDYLKRELEEIEKRLRELEEGE